MGKKLWYLPSEVVVHNKANDIWVSMHGVVYDLTEFVASYVPHGVQNCGACCTLTGGCICKAPRAIKIVTAFAGKDVSHWFEEKTSNYKTYQHAITKTEDIFARHGTFPQTSPVAISPKWRPIERPLWVDDPQYVVGKLTQNPRPIRILNTLTGHAPVIDVCEEETIYDIMEHRYLIYNAHYNSYTWCYKGVPLELDKTLTQNGVLDERDVFYEALLPDDIHVPCVFIYYNDDLTEDIPVITNI